MSTRETCAAAAVHAKIKRLGAGARARVLDLFSGCGGFSLGFQAEGFEIAGAVEQDADAAATHANNFFPQYSTPADSPHAKPRDIARVDPEELTAELGWHDPLDAVDVVIGGPPCQAYARIGRAKLRQVARHPEAYLQDPRGNLYLQFLRYIAAFRPLAVVMENVPEALNYGGHNIAEDLCESLEELNYDCAYTLLNAVEYGVPQLRERVFLIALERTLGIRPSFPRPQRRHREHTGYKTTRSFALRTQQPALFRGISHFVSTPCASDLPPAITAEEAIGDLPPITEHLEGRMRTGRRRFDECARYEGETASGSYAMRMRAWPGFESKDGVVDQVIRHNPRDYPVFREMKEGDLFREALAIAQASSITIPYSPDKFRDKWRKIRRDEPVRTVMAHLAKDSYSHIHYDDAQARTISVREAARLQSFPDGFAFVGSMISRFRQIGNAVPPLLAKALAAHVAKMLPLDRGSAGSPHAPDTGGP